MNKILGIDMGIASLGYAVVNIDDENFVENLSKAIYYFINNPKVRQDYSKRGIETAKLYTRDMYFKRFCGIICTS